MSALPTLQETVAFDLSCTACGYNLRGLAAAGECPECGRKVEQSINPQPIVFPPSQIRWARIVAAGLLLWLFGSFHAMSTVLIMPFTDDYGGSVARLNFVGPKACAVSLIQRSVDYRPGEWGVNGVTCALLVAAAFLMITTAPTDRDWRDPVWTIRFWARWLPLILLGGFLGVTIGSEGVASDDPQVRKFVFAAIVGVEVPATILMYWHLRRLASALNLPRVAGTFLSTCVAILVLGVGSVLLIAIGPSLWYERNAFPLQASVGVYMAISLCAGAAALGGITRLLLELAPIALQRLQPRRPKLS